jgi:hypothetical protein
MRRPSLLAAPLLLVALLAASAPLDAQSLQVSGTQPLRFGTMVPGIDRIAARTDPAAAAEFRIQSNGNRQIQLSFTLPSSMAGPGGARLPVTFGPTDAGFSRSRNIGNQVAFDPRVPYLGQLQGGRAHVYLGATARPAANQAAGNYTATVTLTVVFFP